MALPVPDDAFADILRRLPPRSLAAARCVCKPWRSLVDDRALMRPHLLPHTVHGVLINYIDHDRPHLFSRPQSSSPSTTTASKIDGNLSFVPTKDNMDWWSVMDHCDGLLLCDTYWGSRLCVCNPATRRWATLPPCPEAAAEHRGYATSYIAFDPAVSPHYEVFLIPDLPEKPPPPQPVCPQVKATVAPFSLDDLLASLDGASWTMEEVEESSAQSPRRPPPSSTDDDGDRYGSMEWPPSPYKIDVFSSRSGRWEERAFVREGETVTTVDDMKPWEYAFVGPRRGYSVFWQGALYVHCQGCFVTRFSLSNDKYQVTRTPINIPDRTFEIPYLGKSTMGVSFGFIHDHQLSVWILHKSAGQMEWVLKYQHDLRLFAKQVHSIGFRGDQINGPWILEEDDTDMDENIETLSDKDLEWESDNDDFLPIKVDHDGYDYSYFGILGFHPYKEVIFLDETFRTAAYHLDSSKIQYLGYSRPKCYYQNYTNGIYESFVYTPCMIGELHGDYIGQSSSSRTAPYMYNADI